MLRILTGTTTSGSFWKGHQRLPSAASKQQERPAPCHTPAMANVTSHGHPILPANSQIVKMNLQVISALRPLVPNHGARNCLVRQGSPDSRLDNAAIPAPDYNTQEGNKTRQRINTFPTPGPHRRLKIALYATRGDSRIA